MASRDEAEKQAWIPQDWAVISIGDPEGRTARLHGACDVIYLRFEDVTDAEKGAKEWGKERWQVITQEQAEKIATFVLENREKNFLIHCVAGVSRSVGVARALEPFLSPSHRTEGIHPTNGGNHLVRRLVHQELKKKLGSTDGETGEGKANSPESQEVKDDPNLQLRQG